MTGSLTRLGLAAGAQAGEALRLEGGHGAAPQEGGGSLLAGGIVGVALDQANAEGCDLGQGTLQREGGDTLAAVALRDEKAGDAPVGQDRGGQGHAGRTMPVAQKVQSGGWLACLSLACLSLPARHLTP